MYVGQAQVYQFNCDVCGETYFEDIEHLGLDGDYINAYFIPNSDLDSMREVHICNDCMSNWRMREYEEHMHAIRNLYLDLVQDDDDDIDEYDDDEIDEYDDDDDNDVKYTLTEKGRRHLEALKKRGQI